MPTASYKRRGSRALKWIASTPPPKSVQKWKVRSKRRTFKAKRLETPAGMVSTRAFIAELDGVLKPLGFARKGVTWNRKGRSVVEAIDVQLSKSGDAITINAGVLDPVVHWRLWNRDPPASVVPPACTVCARIGELIDGRDKWWELSDATAAVEAAEEVTAHVLPFLEQTRTREAMMRWLTDTGVTKKGYPPPVISLAIIKSLLGETVEACALLNELQKKTFGAWRLRIAEIAGQLGCE